MSVKVKIHAAGLLNYAKAGKEAVQKIRTAMRKITNAGRTEARRRIASEFRVRTGRLRRGARSLQTKVNVTAAEIKGRVTPLPRLLNIFESGATLAQGRGVLRPRPVVNPAYAVMEHSAPRELKTILDEMGR